MTLVNKIVQLCVIWNVSESDNLCEYNNLKHLGMLWVCCFRLGLIHIGIKFSGVLCVLVCFHGHIKVDKSIQKLHWKWGNDPLCSFLQCGWKGTLGNLQDSYCQKSLLLPLWCETPAKQNSKLQCENCHLYGFWVILCKSLVDTIDESIGAYWIWDGIYFGYWCRHRYTSDVLDYTCTCIFPRAYLPCGNFPGGHICPDTIKPNFLYVLWYKMPKQKRKSIVWEFCEN